MSSSATVTFRSEVGEGKGHPARPNKGAPGILVLQECKECDVPLPYGGACRGKPKPARRMSI